MYRLLFLIAFFHFDIVNGFKQPHIIFFVADDLGWNDVSWHNPGMITPNLEYYAEMGVKLNQSYVQPVCTPSRTAFMTGYYPFRTGRQNSYLRYLQPTGLSLNFTLLPEKLQKLGYATHIVGKWHLGYCNWNYTPTYRGFDTFFGYYGGSEDYYTHSSSTDAKAPSSVPRGNADHYLDFRNQTLPAEKYSGIYSADIFVDAVVNVLSNSDPKQPLFLYLPFQSVHAPLQVPKRWENLYKHIKDSNRRIYSGMVSAMDDAFGRIMKALQKYKFFEDSVLIFTTDNGGQTKAGGNNWPLRGNKATLWEGGTRGVGFVYSKYLKKKRYTNNKLIHAVDWYPTILHLAGSKTDNQSIDGVNQWDVISKSNQAARNEFVYNIFDTDIPRSAIRVGDYKLLWGDPGNPSGWIPPPEWSMRTERILPTNNSKTTLRLYNISDDPMEKINLVNDIPKVAELLRQKLIAYSKEMVPADEPKDDPKGNPMYWKDIFSPGWCLAH